MSDYVIETRGLTKTYGEQNSVSNLSIHVRKGRIYGLLGRNGAGKTTTMRMLLGLTAPSSGDVKIFGKPLRGNEKNILPRIGSLIESPGFYPNLTGTENLRIFADLRGLKSPKDIKGALEVVNLPYRDKKLFSQYSLGMKQRLAIAAYARAHLALGHGHAAPQHNDQRIQEHAFQHIAVSAAKHRGQGGERGIAHPVFHQQAAAAYLQRHPYKDVQRQGEQAAGDQEHQQNHSGAVGKKTGVQIDLNAGVLQSGQGAAGGQPHQQAGHKGTPVAVGKNSLGVSFQKRTGPHNGHLTDIKNIPGAPRREPCVYYSRKNTL